MFTQKILCIGNETQTTDDQVSVLANLNNTINHGLISDSNQLYIDAGYYHTSVVDCDSGEIIKIANQFDLVLLLDQPMESYPHFKSFITTIKLMCYLEQRNINTKFRDVESAKNLLFWQQYLIDNKSFCFHPFAALINISDYTVICPKNFEPITPIDNIISWKDNKEYSIIRNKMLAGELMPERCSDCYSREAEGQESTRQFETLEWAMKLNLKSPGDFSNLENPAFYEIRPNNLCNIMCRTCDSAHSHLIEREWKKIGIPVVPQYFATTPFDKIDFSNAKRIYWGGGDPTVMPEFYAFLENCIQTKNVNFELCIGTNGMKFSDKMMLLLDHFPDVCFSISYDGYKKVNDYIRWGSDFDTIVNNGRKVQERGHTVGMQTVFSMYSISRLHEVFEFYDQEYPGLATLVQVGAGHDEIFMPYNHPRPDLVLDSMRRCQQTNVYYSNGRSVKSMIDLLIDYYSNPNYTCNIELLKTFYEFNDKLDNARNSKLGDYIPELAEARNIYDI